MSNSELILRTKEYVQNVHFVIFSTVYLIFRFKHLSQVFLEIT